MEPPTAPSGSGTHPCVAFNALAPDSLCLPPYGSLPHKEHSRRACGLTQACTGCCHVPASTGRVCSVVSASFAMPQTVAHQDPLSLGFSRQEYWSRLLFPTPGDLPHPGIEPVSLALADGFLSLRHLGSCCSVGMLSEFKSTV